MQWELCGYGELEVGRQVQVLWCCGLWDGIDGIGGCGELCFRQKERHSLMAAFAAMGAWYHVTYYIMRYL